MVSPKDHIMIVWYQASFTVVITHYDVIIIIKYSHACLMWPESGHKPVYSTLQVGCQKKRGIVQHVVCLVVHNWITACTTVCAGCSLWLTQVHIYKPSTGLSADLR